MTARDKFLPLTEPRLRRLARAAMLVQILLFAFFVAGSHNAFVPLKRPTTTDFASFYAAGRIADGGHAGDAYDVQAHRAIEERVTAPGIDYKYFLNPPVFLLICAPLAKLPYLLAFVVFEVLTFAFWLAVSLRIAGGGRTAMLSLIAIPADYWAFGWGQNSFLTAGLMGVGTLCLRRRPILAGAAFGALCIKPHFGVLIPIALLCGRHFRAVAAAAVTVAALIGLSVLVFGAESWRGFIEMALHARGTIESGRISFAGHIDPGGALRLLGLGPTAGWSVQAVASLAAAASVGWVWWPRHRGTPVADEVRFMALVAGTMIAMPFLLFYDLVMAGIAACWLVRLARRTGWLAGEQAVLLFATAAALLAFPAAAVLHVALGCLVAPALLWCALRRAMTPALPVP